MEQLRAPWQRRALDRFMTLATNQCRMDGNDTFPWLEDAC